ncbi:hypothetical protein C0989_010950 [Termitomyces sp. Mn162]|nr:hypothetical protein C0989_010950 [Termitomyces sp. Mn162]
MRMVPATLGVATVPLAYLTLRQLDCRATTALLVSLFITFENGLITQSRLILLDSPLIFFTALTIFFWTGFSSEDKHKPFTSSWWTWLTLTGLSLGAVVSCKWVGLFTIATVGVSTVLQLWNLLGDLRVPPSLFVRHFMARAICLIAIPIVFYMTMFQIHFLILENSGDGDGFMSSEFQHTLGGRGMVDTYADVGVGSLVTIRHLNTQGGYLHSHVHTYPGGSKQQQVTLYPHRDGNNDWRIFNASDHTFDWSSEPLSYIVHGTRIKLQHVATEKHLHSHDHRPPVSDVDFQNEVSAYGLPGFAGDANDDWYLEIEHGDRRDSESAKRLRTLRTVFRLRHGLTGCYLFSHKVKLPDWGFEQQEVTCNKNAVKANSLWYIETAQHPVLPPDAPKVNYKLPGFFGKFFELQQVMWTTNAGLTDRHTYDSRPESWPRLLRGIVQNFWVKDHRQIYLIGNPIVWWLSTAAVVAYALVRGFLILRAQRGYRDFDNTKVVKYDSLCGFLFVGWFLHYFPFFIMGRQLFLHHYFPALYFAVMLTGVVFDLVTSTLRPKIRLQIAAVLVLLAIWQFSRFSPLAYGTPWTKSKCLSAKMLKTWDFSCYDFLDEYSQYNNIAATPVKSQIPVAHTTVGGEADGRPAIVIPHGDDNEPLKPYAHLVQANADADAGDSETTGIRGENVPEPGRNVFDRLDAGADVKSKNEEHVTQEALPTTTEVVAVTNGGGGVSVAAPIVDGTSAEKDGLVNEKDVTVKDSEDKESSTTTLQSTEVEKEKPVVAGPLGEAEHEAKKAAEELFPDDVR